MALKDIEKSRPDPTPKIRPEIAGMATANRKIPGAALCG